MTQNSAAGPHVLKVVAIGGGTGLSTLLRGLKHYVLASSEEQIPDDSLPVITNLSGIVTVSDDGGSSGRLRRELNVIAPGDVRNCIVALSEDEALLSRLFRYRFDAGQLEGHNFGNLFLTALASVCGDFSEAVRVASEVLATRGTIYPATTSNVQLDGWMHDGTRVRGETNITASKARIIELRMVPANAQPLPQALHAIQDADLITIGPGSLFTSLIPNMLVRAIPSAIQRSSAVKVYVCNLMTQANESLGLTASDHIRAIFQHARGKVFDYALVNTTRASNDLRAKYALEGATQIVADSEGIRELGVEPITGDYLDQTDIARHATERVAHDLLRLVTSLRSAQVRA
jgi:uncharacterized cofD-like protein